MSDDPDIGAGNRVELVPLKRTWESTVIVLALLLISSALVMANGLAPPGHTLNGKAMSGITPPPCNPNVDYNCTPTPCAAGDMTCNCAQNGNCTQSSVCDPSMNICPSAPCDPNAVTQDCTPTPLPQSTPCDPSVTNCFSPPTDSATP